MGNHSIKKYERTKKAMAKIVTITTIMLKNNPHISQEIDRIQVRELKTVLKKHSLFYVIQAYNALISAIKNNPTMEYNNEKIPFYTKGIADYLMLFMNKESNLKHKSIKNDLTNVGELKNE